MINRTSIATVAVLMVAAFMTWRYVTTRCCMPPPVYALDEYSVFESANELAKVYANSLVYVFVHPPCACNTRDAKTFLKFASRGDSGTYFFESTPSPFIQPPQTYDGDLPYVARFSKGKLTDILKMSQL